MTVQTLLFGEWPSPITAAEVAASELSIGNVTALGDEVWWDEVRPQEDGRTAVVRRRADGTVLDVLPRPWQARTRVHEYGGRSWMPLPGVADDEPSLVFAHWDDQRLYVLEGGTDHARPLTPAPEEPADLRYADPVLSADGREILCIREAHVAGRIIRRVVAVPLDGSASEDPAAIREVAGDSDFVAHARVSPDGSRIAWIAWNHPQMPWDGTELRVAELEGGVAFGVRTILGGKSESVLQPEWASEDAVYVVSDRSGWWNLYRLDLGPPTADSLTPAEQAAAVDRALRETPEPVAVCPSEEEFGVPMWLLGYISYVVLGEGNLAVLHGVGASRLGLVNTETGTLTDVAEDFCAWKPTLAVVDGAVIGVAGSASHLRSVVHVDVQDGTVEILSPVETAIDPAYLPVPTSEVLQGSEGRVVHAHVYAPRNPTASAPAGELPPYVVFVHGGPTSQAQELPDLEVAYFTSRGIGVIDVDYGGSTGYGRAYRELLLGQWGVVDVEDCVAAARALVERGEADPRRLGIRGGSAGGWTTLAAVATSDAFAAGVSYYGVADLLSFAQDTHDFESRYLDSLVGPLPEANNLYVQRSPLTHIDKVTCPVLLLQGDEDAIVPPSQSWLIRDALAANGVPHAYLEFPGEQHGFRKADSIERAVEAELAFYGHVFAFEPPGVSPLALSGGSSD